MFPNAMFAGAMFPGAMFPPVLEEAVITPPTPGGAPGGRAGGVDVAEFLAKMRKDEDLKRAQILQEDEEILDIVTAIVTKGLL